MTAPLRIGVAVAALAIASCAPRAPSPRPVPPSERPPAERPLAAAAYLARAASIDLYQVRAGELAQERASTQGLTMFARKMIEEHRGMAAQLSLAGRRLNLLPATVMQAEQQAWLHQLTASAPGTEFDATYRRQQSAAHDASYRLHYAFAQGGESPTLRLVARSAAGIETDHRQLLRSL